LSFSATTLLVGWVDESLRRKIVSAVTYNVLIEWDVKPTAYHISDSPRDVTKDDIADDLQWLSLVISGTRNNYLDYI